MKKCVFFAAMLLLAACSHDESDVFNGSAVENQKEVTLTFSPYQMEAMTRTPVSISTIVTHLDVWLVEGSNVIGLHQTSSDSGFGSLSVTLDKTKTYTLYAVGHKCTGNATFENGVISIPDDKVTHSMFYTTSFCPATTTSLNCEMQRIVAQFRLETTDAVPDECKKVRITIDGVYDRWNVTTGGTHSLNRISTLNVNSTNQDGTAVFNVFAIVTNTQTNHSITVEALDANDAAVQTPRVFANVPLRIGYKTTYRGALFSEAGMAMSFLCDDWNDYDTVNF